MGRKCEKCQDETPSKSDRFCLKHARQTLRKLEAEGYLEPLRYTTQDGVQVLSTKRFLTLSEEPNGQSGMNSSD